MTPQMPIEYPFPANPEATEYRVFPPHLENDNHVFFHGTADANRHTILANGFKFPPPPLAQSISFATTSSLALRYASQARGVSPAAGCIFAVRYDDLTRNGLKPEMSMLHDYTLDPAPLIIGYCIVPPDYRHI